MSMGLARIAAVALPLALAAGAAQAELSQAKFDASREAVAAYAREMTEALPCIVLAFSGAPAGAAKIADEHHGDAAVRQTIAAYIAREKGSRADEQALLLAWFENVRPQYAQDIRTLSAFCEQKGYLVEVAQFRGVAIPLDRRAPFRTE